jgi:hypothetical protein
MGPWDVWQRQSPSQSGGEVRRHKTCDSDEAHLSREVKSGAIEHVTALEPTLARR